MMKRFYVTAWVLLAVAAFVTVFSGALNAAALVIFSLLVLGLVFALALWSVLVNTAEVKTE